MAPSKNLLLEVLSVVSNVVRTSEELVFKVLRGALTVQLPFVSYSPTGFAYGAKPKDTLQTFSNVFDVTTMWYPDTGGYARYSLTANKTFRQVFW